MTTYYTRQSLRSLFLICAFPLHLWTIVFGLIDMSWTTVRTNLWDAVGVLSYALTFTFLESLVVWLAATLLGFLLPRHWDAGRRAMMMGMLVLIAAIWAMAGSLYFLLGKPFPAFVLNFLARSGHPLKLLFAGSGALVLFTFAVPLYLSLRSEHFCNKVQEGLKNLALLSSVYIALDAVGLFIVIIRNL
jgi:hypothetical protein